MFTFSYSYENARDNDPPDNDPTFPVKSFGSSLGVTAINAWEMIVRKVPDAKVLILSPCLEALQVRVER